MRRQDVLSRERGLFKNGRLWWIRTVRIPGLPARSLSTGTTDLRRANAIKRMVDLFMTPGSATNRWLGYALKDECTLADVYDHHSAGELHMFELVLAAQREPDLDVMATTWIRDVLPTLDIGERSRAEYARHVRYFVPEGKVMKTSELTGDYIQSKLAEITGARHDRTLAANTTTRRQYLSSLRQFVRWVRRRLPRLVEMPDPFLHVQTPKKIAPRMTFYEYPKVRRLLDHVESPEYRAALALLFGSGIEMGALMAMRGEHVGAPAERTVVALGTKNEYRENRTIFVDKWAWELFYAHARQKLPKAALWSFSPSQLRTAFYRAQVAAGLLEKPPRSADGNPNWNAVRPHTLHDCRHSYTVNRALGLDGEPPRDTGYISAQLGHADEATVLRVYKKLNIAERLRLSQQAVSAATPAPPHLSLAQ